MKLSPQKCANYQRGLRAASLMHLLFSILCRPDSPTGCCLVHYRARGNKKHYWYYKLQASEPIFPTKTGKMTRYKHLGVSGTEAHIEALMQINRRNQLEALSRTLDSLMQCWSDLYENSNSDNQS